MKDEDIKKIVCNGCDRKQESCETTFCNGAIKLKAFSTDVYAVYSGMKGNLANLDKMAAALDGIKKALGELYVPCE